MDPENLALVSTIARYIVTAYLMAISNEIADLRGLLVEEKARPLPDLGFDVVPYLPSLVWVPDALNQIALLVVAVRIFCGPRRRRVACVFLNLHMILMVLRSLMIATTTFPAASPACHGRTSERPTHLFLAPIQHMIYGQGLRSWCHDLMFSGHAAVFAIAALFLQDAGGELYWRVIGWAIGSLGCVLLIATRLHYTADVVVALLVSLLVYWRYSDEIVGLYHAEPERLD